MYNIKIEQRRPIKSLDMRDSRFVESPEEIAAKQFRI